ncbi:DUF3140 domain-containing protein [Microbacteriaceae bacterium VKM Ac-2855]|nr:DUF3140 domain-containing protein [Microbacteriaceae bacterium VKM Ac-2855]
MTDDDRKQLRADFDAAVNMTAGELGRWLETNASKKIGQKDDGSGESVGHRSGRHIIRILGTKQADLSDADYDHMRKVLGYIHRHQAQRPHGDTTDTPWRYSLMNWGHDPDKK